jgi:hypothetical protein
MSGGLSTILGFLPFTVIIFMKSPGRFRENSMNSAPQFAIVNLVSLAGGEALSVDASLIKADVGKSKRTPVAAELSAWGHIGGGSTGDPQIRRIGTPMS